MWALISPRLRLSYILTVALIWMRAHPELKSHLSRILRLIPGVEHKFLKFARRKIKAHKASSPLPIWGIDADPHVLREWKMIVNKVSDIRGAKQQ